MSSHWFSVFHSLQNSNRRALKIARDGSSITVNTFYLYILSKLCYCYLLENCIHEIWWQKIKPRGETGDGHCKHSKIKLVISCMAKATCQTPAAVTVSAATQTFYCDYTVAGGSREGADWILASVSASRSSILNTQAKNKRIWLPC